MNIETVRQRVTEIATQKGVYEQEIYNRLIAYLETSYNYSVPTEQEHSIVEGVKNKILTVLYSKDRQRMTVNRAIKYNQVFSLDEVEMKFLEKVFTQLESDGLISCLAYEISLTEKGVITARNL